MAQFVCLPFCFAFVFFFVTLYINSLVQVWADRNSPNWLPALPDIGHKLLPYWTYYSINNYYLLTAFALVIIRYVFQRDIRLIVLRRWLFLQAVMFIMRSVSIYVTSLSVPLPGCNTTAVGSAPIEAFYIMSLIHATCGDVLFSGHTVTCKANQLWEKIIFVILFYLVTLCALAWTTYSKGEEHYPIRWLWSRITGNPEIVRGRPGWLFPKLDSAGDPLSFYITTLVVWTFTIIGYLFIIATRFHYTVDVFLGYLLSKLTWDTYHYYIKSLAERRSIVITRFFLWFEGYGRLPANVPVSLLTGPSYSMQEQQEQPEHMENPSEVARPGDARNV